MSLLKKPNPMVITPDDEVMALIWDKLSGAMRYQLAIRSLKWKNAKSSKNMANGFALLTWARVCENFPHYAKEIRTNCAFIAGEWRG